MDQGRFVDINSFDEDDVKLDEVPTSAEHYLKQVMIDRRRHATVLKVDVDTSQYRSRQTLVVRQHAMTIQSAPAGLAPPLAWQHQQVADFSDLRQKLFCLRAQMKQNDTIPTIRFPDLSNEAGWKKFCYQKISSQLDVGETELKENDRLKVHNGTPPLLKIMLAMCQPELIDCLSFQIQWFVSEGYSTARMHWLFSLLTLLEKPLEPDVCASLRDLTRHCIQLRMTLTKEDPMVREFSWFICIVSRYFDQSDLADK